VLERSEASLEAHFQALEGNPAVRVVCIDLTSVYRPLIRKYAPSGEFVGDFGWNTGPEVHRSPC